MLRIPWLFFAVSFVILAVQSFWLPWFLWFFTSSLMTATFFGTKLLLRAPISRHTFPAHPPPLPDPWSSDLTTAIWSLEFLRVLAPHFNTLWQNISLATLLPFVLPLLLAPNHFIPPALDHFSNTHGRPSWFVNVPHRRTTGRLVELHHWHHDWSFDDFFFWSLLSITTLGYSAGCFLLECSLLIAF